MNASSAQPGAGLGTVVRAGWFWAAAGLVVCLVAVSGDSLWVDEALTASEVTHPTIGGMWALLMHDKGSDLQMPLYVFQLWGWVKIFGSSEWALRAVNIPWFVAGFAAMACAYAGRERWFMALTALMCPFAWYFLNEARTYAVELSTSLMAFAALHRLARNGSLTPRAEGGWVAVFCFGVVCLSGSSLLGMIWAGAFVLAAGLFVPWQRLVGLARAHRLAGGLSLGLLAATGLYYLWTLKVGARATGGNTDARNLLFIAYELLGFGGLGPGRLEIREGTTAVFFPYVFGLSCYGMLLLIVLLAGLRQLGQEGPRGRLFVLLAIITTPMLILVGAGLVMHFRVLERHFAPVLPVIVYALAAGLAGLWRRGHWATRAVVCAFVVLSFASCLEVRFAPRHKKDDYRDAAAFAKAALGRGQIVWWDAGQHGAAYYHLAFGTDAEKQQQAILVSNPDAKVLAGLPTPEIVITSKPDMFDGRGAVAEFLRKAPYAKIAVYPAVTVWQRKTAVP